MHACTQAMGTLAAATPVLLVAVTPERPFAYDGSPQVLDQLDKDLKAQHERLQAALDEAAAKARELGLEPTAVLDDQGMAHERITAHAKEAGGRLIVLGCHHGAGLTHRLVGTVISRVVGFSHTDVLVVPESVTCRQGPVLVATDGSEHSRKALDRAAECAKDLDAKVVVLAVAEAPRGVETYHLNQLSISILEERAGNHAREALKALASKGLDADMAVKVGEPDALICQTAESISAGLIIMGSHGRTGLKRLLMGSTTERVLEKAPCPVLITMV